MTLKGQYKPGQFPVPPELTALIAKFDDGTRGPKQRAAKAAGLHPAHFAKLSRGVEKTTEGTLARIRAALGDEAASPVPLQSSVSPPEFVPWDQKTRSIVIPKTKNRNKRTIKNVPSMLADLIEQNDYNFAAVGRAMSVVGTTAQLWAEEGAEYFNEKRQRQVFAGLHGQIATGLNGSGADEPDRFSLGLAIVQLQAKNFDRVNDVAELLNGRLVFKLNTTAGWILIYRMKGQEDLQKFKRIVSRDSGKIVCP